MNKFDNERFGLWHYPKQIVIETTTACNQKCTHCAHRLMTRPGGRMSFDLFEKIVEEIGGWGAVPEIWLTFYGDALLLGASRLFTLIQLARNVCPSRLILNTNGVLLDDERRFVLIHSSLDELIISVDAFTEATYNLIRGRGLQGVVDNVLKLRDELEAAIKISTGTDSRGQPYTIKWGPRLRRPLDIMVQFSQMDENRHERDAFIAFWLSQGIRVKTRDKLSWMGAVDAPGPGNQVRQPCGWALNTAAITWNGDLVICACDGLGKHVIGNVRERSIRSLWSGSGEIIRRAHFDRRWDDLPDTCQTCTDWAIVGTQIHTPTSM